MKPGPPKTPTVLLELRGSHRAKGRRGEPKPGPKDSSPPFRPRWLAKHPRAVECWEYHAGRLSKMGICTKIDRNALARYCYAHAEYLRAADVVAEEGSTVTVHNSDGQPTGLKEHPESARMFKLDAQMLRIEGRFGLTPADRASFGTDDMQAEPSDDMERKLFSRSS